MGRLPITQSTLGLNSFCYTNTHIERKREMSEDMGGVKLVSKWPPVIVMVTSQVAMGSVNALVKKALDVGVNHMIVGAYRMAISSFILAPIAYFLERFIDILMYNFKRSKDYFHIYIPLINTYYKKKVRLEANKIEDCENSLF